MAEIILGKLCANCNRINSKDADKCIQCGSVALEEIYSFIEAESEESEDVS